MGSTACALAALVLLGAACSSAATPEPPQGPIVSPYVDVTVESVRVRLRPTSPPQVELTIRGTLPDTCDYRISGLENRGEGSIQISLQGIHPMDLMCAQTLQPVEYTWVLGQDLPAAERALQPGSYELSVNAYRTTIEIP